MYVRKTVRGARSVLALFALGVSVSGIVVAQQAELGLPQVPPQQVPTQVPGEQVAQGKKEEKKPPVLPPTKVEADPVAPTLPEPPPDLPPPPGSGGPLSAGGIFSSPSVEGYRAGTATTGTKVDVPLIDYPGTVRVVTQDTIRDQQALRVDDFLRNIPGAVKAGDFMRDSFFVRGFEVRSRDYRFNGFVDPGPVARDVANIERVELLVGPSAALYGSGGVSGVFNFITKKALDRPYNNVTFSGGSFGLLRTTVDSTGPIDQQGRFLYRVNAAYETRDGFRDFGFQERTFVAPVFTWMIDEDTSLTFEGSYINDRRRADTGVVAINGQLPLPIQRFLNEPNDFQRFNDYKTSVWLTHQFGDGWTGRLGGFANWYDNPSTVTNPISNGAPFGFPPTVLFRQVQDTPVFQEQYYQMIGDLSGRFCTGHIKHDFLVGTSMNWFHSNFQAKLSDPAAIAPLPFPPFFFLAPTSPIDVNNPVYGASPNLPLPGSFDATVNQSRFGFYAQDLIEISEKWKAIVGVRYDIINTEFENALNSPFAGANIGFPKTTSNNANYRLNPRVGLVYQPIPETLAFYGSYNETFEPPISGAFRNPTTLKPEIGRMGEAGIKWDLFDKRLSLTACGFYLVKENVVVADTTFFATQIGRQRSQGAELSAVGRVTQNLDIIANYAYVDSRILDDTDPTLVGNRFRGVPYNTANLWARYNLIDNCCQTLGVGLGGVFLGDRTGDLAATFDLPGFARWDAGVFYRRNRLNANLYLENLFDTKYYTSSVNSLAVFPGAPFTVRGQLGWTF